MKGLYLVQWLSSEIKLRYKAAPGMTIYLMECLWSQAWENITRWNPNPKYNSSQIQLDGRVLVISVGHMTSDGRCGHRGLNRGLNRIAADGPWDMCRMLVNQH